MRYEIPANLLGTYRQMTIDTTAVLDPDGFTTDDRTDADAIMALVRKAAVRDFVESHQDDDQFSDAELIEMFRLAYDREPDDEDYDNGLWSLICAVAQMDSGHTI